MIGMMGSIPVGSHISMGSNHERRSSDETLSFDNMVFGFPEEEGSFNSVSSGGSSAHGFDDEKEPNQTSVDDPNKNKAFWESQHQLLLTTLYRTSSLESKIREATKEALVQSKTEGVMCICRTPIDNVCRNCLLNDISDRLKRAGHDSAICKSKWRSSPEFPSGEHTYIDVVHKSGTKEIMEVRVVIELEFRAEFEMARASEEYNTLIERLPEFYVGKAERLRRLIKILCSAAKRCTKDSNVHMGPWRKHKYMQAKWFGNCETTMSGVKLSSLQLFKKPKGSLLAFDSLEVMNRSAHHFTTVV